MTDRRYASWKSLLVCVFFVALLAPSHARAAATWDSQELTTNQNPAGSATQWWFDPANWSNESPASILTGAPYYLPPNNDMGVATDTQINDGTGTLPGGEGVVYDPTNDPNFAAIGAHPADYPFPAGGFGAQNIRELYLGRAQTGLTSAPANLLTIKGDLTLQATMVLGRSSNIANTPSEGRINQLSGTVKVNLAPLDIAGTDTSTTQGQATSYGNGVYDYRGGILEVSKDGGAGLRLSPSSGTVGAGGVGRFIMRNPGTPGYVRPYDMNVAAGAGAAARLANGTTTGVGIVEFHSSGTNGTRPIQVGRNLVINNGTSGTTPNIATRSSRLELVLDSAPSVDGNGVPQNLGLFDVDFDQFDVDPANDNAPFIGNSTTGAGSMQDFFSSANGSTLYNQGVTVSATFAGSTYNWTISYTGNIVWAGTQGVEYGNSGVVTSISDTGGVDVVLKGLSSVIVPPGLAGDFNNDTKVDASDYVTWRKNEVSNASLPNDGGAAGQAARYTLWRSNYGNPPGTGSGLGAAAVPEPQSILLMLCGLVGATLARRQR